MQYYEKATVKENFLIIKLIQKGNKYNFVKTSFMSLHNSTNQWEPIGLSIDWLTETKKTSGMKNFE